MNYGGSFGENIVKKGLDQGSILIDIYEPLRWATGHLMPIDVRMDAILSDYSQREMIREGLRYKIRDLADCMVVEVGNTITGGVGVADHLQTKIMRVKENPEHYELEDRISGLNKGEVLPGSRILIVAGTISTAETVVQGVECVRGAGGRCEHVLSLFDYGFEEAKQRLRISGCETRSLVKYGDLLKVLNERDSDAATDLIPELEKWHADPFNWWENKKKELERAS